MTAAETDIRIGAVWRSPQALTLIQTGKVSNFAVVLVGTEHWEGQLDWLRAQLLGQSRIGPLDLALLHLTDDPDEVCDIVTSGHAAQVAALEARP